MKSKWVEEGPKIPNIDQILHRSKWKYLEKKLVYAYIISLKGNQRKKKEFTNTHGTHTMIIWKEKKNEKKIFTEKYT